MQVLAGTVLGHVGPARASDRPRRRERGSERTAHALPDPPGRRRGAADRPQADPRRLGAARKHLDLPGQGREPVPRQLADGRAGAAGVQGAARAAGAERPRDPPRPRAGARTSRPGRSTGGCWRRSSSCPSRACSPTVSSLRCSHVARRRRPPTRPRPPPATRSTITAVNGIPIAGHQGPGSIADITIRKLLTLQGTMRPSEIVSLTSYPGHRQHGRGARPRATASTSSSRRCRSARATAARRRPRAPSARRSRRDSGSS